MSLYACRFLMEVSRMSTLPQTEYVMVQQRAPTPGREAPPASPVQIRIVAAIVACNRPRDVERLLGRLLLQTQPVDAVVVVDNGTDAETPEICARHGAQHHRSEANLGGAGGFALAILLALAQGADQVWLWDDDGWPEAEDCLARLLAFQQATGAAIAAPLVLDAEDPRRCAFAFRFAGRSTCDRAEVTVKPVIEGHAHLFNGALIPAETFHRHGLPDLRFFIRGDEVEFMLRVQRAGGRVATLTAATARHPSGRREAYPILGGRLHAVYPPDELRRATMYRNRGYIFARYGLPHLLAADVLRYAIFFLGRRQPEWAGYQAWLSATWQGLRGKLGRPPQSMPKRQQTSLPSPPNCGMLDALPGGHRAVAGTPKMVEDREQAS